MNPKTCHCGHHLGDPEIQEDPEYGVLGWIMLSIFGITPRPDHISFRCILCQDVLGTSRSAALLARRSQRAAAR